MAGLQKVPRKCDGTAATVSNFDRDISQSKTHPTNHRMIPHCWWSKLTQPFKRPMFDGQKPGWTRIFPFFNYLQLLPPVHFWVEKMLKRPRLGSVHRLGEAKNVPTPVISTCYRSLAVWPGDHGDDEGSKGGKLLVLVGGLEPLEPWNFSDFPYFIYFLYELDIVRLTMWTYF